MSIIAYIDFSWKWKITQNSSICVIYLTVDLKTGIMKNINVDLVFQEERYEIQKAKKLCCSYIMCIDDNAKLCMGRRGWSGKSCRGSGNAGYVWGEDIWRKLRCYREHWNNRKHGDYRCRRDWGGYGRDRSCAWDTGWCKWAADRADGDIRRNIRSGRDGWDRWFDIRGSGTERGPRQRRWW